MKVASNWLNDYLSKPLTAREQAEALELAGVEIEQIISSKPLDKNIVVAQVKKVIQHPNADKLKLTEVDAGEGILKVVCGASNVRPGLKVALAQVGTVLPDGTEIKAAQIRGEESHGMLCSARELGWGEDHSGITELDLHAEVGQRLCDLRPADDVLDFSTHPNRPDLNSVVGLAREIAAFADVKLKLPETEELGGDGEEIEVVIEAAKKVPRYLAQKFAVDQRYGTAPWAVQRLEASGIRSIGPVVDITNYTLLEYGQPLHAFDAAKIKLPIVVRMAKNGEKLVTLDGVKRKLTEHDLVIADQGGPIALAGVMGGAGSEVSDKTKEIIIESATFDAATVRKTAVRHGLRTEASARFERGLPLQLAELGLSRAATILGQAAGGKAISPATDRLQIWPWVQRIGLRTSRLEKISGLKLSADEIVDRLSQLGIGAEKFDIAAEARKHLAKPYKWGANFKQDGTEAFDCSYFTDYIYSLIGLQIGHTAHAQYQFGRPVHTGELKPGDNLFRGGPWEKLSKEERGGVSHNYLYVGGGKVIHAKHFERDEDEQWVPIAQPQVIEEPLEIVINDPEYLGARRYVEDLGGYISVPEVPWWRPDLRVEEDLLEEVVRLEGYDKVPATLPRWHPDPRQVRFDHWWPQLWRTKSALKGLGLFEVMTYSFVSEQQLRESGYKPADHLKLKNPLSQEQAYLRRNLLPSLLSTLARNSRYAKEFGLFEVSRVFEKQGKGDLPKEPTHLGVIRRVGTQGYESVKQVLDQLGREFNLEVKLKPAKDNEFHPGRVAEILAGGRLMGRIGELHPDLLAAHKLKGAVGYLEIDLRAIFELARPISYRSVSRFPTVSRDLALLAPQSVSWAQVNAVLSAAGFEQAEFVSDFYGPGIEAGHKSLAVRLTFSAKDRTLTDEEADKLANKALAVLQQEFKVKLR